MQIRSLVSMAVQKQVLSSCAELHASIQPLNKRLRGPLDRTSDSTTKMPFVFLLGNHSSGKSSFVNYVLQRSVQTAGVAPTDDCFTILVPGPSDMDRDGPALIGDPDMGFNGLKHFGPTLVHHTRLKIRANTAVKDFMLVDSPGMIDSPTARHHPSYDTLRMDRGYDFENVVRWYAERADIILLFFDPDKPGTTGETLSILTNALAGMDHKLLILLNKADQFRKIHDFARAYGSLCWNLSKVIQTKDLPRIYTMCLPPSYQHQDSSRAETSLGKGLEDLETTREDVVAEVLKAPHRRIDNAITRIADSASLLHMHARVVDTLYKEYRRELWKTRLVTSCAFLLSAGGVSTCVYFSFPVQAIVSFGALGMFGTIGSYLLGLNALRAKSAYLVSIHGVADAFERLYARQIAEKDEFTLSLWNRVKDNLKVSFTTQDLESMSGVRASELLGLERIVDDDVPKLRRLTAPPQFDSQTDHQS